MMARGGKPRSGPTPDMIERASAIVRRLSAIDQVFLAGAEHRRFPVAADSSAHCQVTQPNVRLEGLGRDHLVAGVDFALELHRRSKGATPAASSGAVGATGAGAARGTDGAGGPGESGESGATGDHSRLFAAKASYVIIYRLVDGPIPDRALAEAFARQNAIFSVLPFWREWVANAMTRSGLPPIMMPVMKFAKRPTTGNDPAPR